MISCSLGHITRSDRRSDPALAPKHDPIADSTQQIGHLCGQLPLGLDISHPSSHLKGHGRRACSFVPELAADCS